jgi:hypothetical protein
MFSTVCLIIATLLVLFAAFKVNLVTVDVGWLGIAFFGLSMCALSLSIPVVLVLAGTVLLFLRAFGFSRMIDFGWLGLGLIFISMLIH